MTNSQLPKVVADGPLPEMVLDLVKGKVDVLPWEHFDLGVDHEVTGVYTYGHPTLDGTLMDRFPNLRVISNNGVGVDHIQLDDALVRGIPVGNTPGVLDGATADMGFALLMAAGRRLVESDGFARSSAYDVHRPGQILGREIHGMHLGIVGMGRIGLQVARRAKGFDMSVSYHNRNRRLDIEQSYGVQYQELDTLLLESDYVMLTVPLTSETRGLIGARELQLMKPTAVLVNVARGPVVDTDALTRALEDQQIYAAGLDVTDPEPLPRDHRLLQLKNVVIAPHIGSATIQTRQRMAELSIQNLMAGLGREPLVHRVV